MSINAVWRYPFVVMLLSAHEIQVVFLSRLRWTICKPEASCHGDTRFASVAHSCAWQSGTYGSRKERPLISLRHACAFFLRRQRQVQAKSPSMSQQALNKIAPNSPSRAKPNEIETNIATALYELETNIPDMKAALRPLQFVSAREVS